MASNEQQAKRPLDAADADEHPAKRAHITDAGGAAEQPGQSVSAPLVGEQVEVHTLLPALQQLLQVYKVEYWALMEELRARHCAFREAGRISTANQQKEAQEAIEDETVLQASKCSIRELVQAALPQQHVAQKQQLAGDAQIVQNVQGDQQVAVYGDDRCGHGSLQEQPALPALQAVEQLLLRLPDNCNQGVASPEQLQQWHERFKSTSGTVAELEQLASAATLQLMDAQGALACLCGTAGRWMIRRTAVSIGRSSDTKGDVDVDLSRAAVTPPTAPGSARADGGTTASAAADAGGDAMAAGPAVADSTAGSNIKKVSRLQAQLFLELDGQWVIRNTGRAQLLVNGSKVARGDKVPLPHLSLLEVGGEPLLFMVNGMAVQRATVRSNQLVM